MAQIVRKKFFFEYWAVGDVSCGGSRKVGVEIVPKVIV